MRTRGNWPMDCEGSVAWPTRRPTRTWSLSISHPASGSRQDTVGRLREQGLLCTGLYKLRLVTHLDVSASDIDRAVRILRETL